MKAVVITGPGQLELQELPIPAIGRRDVLVQVKSVGICGTDLHIFDGHYAPSLPITPGHEFAGVVFGVGADVTEVSIGDAVAADPNIYCGHCTRCRSGLTNLCLNHLGLGVELPGAMAEFVSVPASNCVILDSSVEVMAACLIEPLSCAVHALDTLNARIGQHVLIYGAGPMGLILASLANRALAASVSVVDLNSDRLAWATTAGARETATSAVALSVEEFGVVIDCTGAVSAIEDGISRVAPGGIYLQFGVPREDARVRISPERLLMSELTLTGSRAVHQSFERAAAIFATGVIDSSFLISDSYGLEAAEAAFEQFRAGLGRKIRLVP